MPCRGSHPAATPVAKSLFERRRFRNQAILRGGSSPVSLSSIYKTGSGLENASVNFAQSQQAILVGISVPKMTCQDATQARNTRKH
jgi:hypothetical protein